MPRKTNTYTHTHTHTNMRAHTLKKREGEREKERQREMIIGDLLMCASFVWFYVSMPLLWKWFKSQLYKSKQVNFIPFRCYMQRNILINKAYNIWTDFIDKFLCVALQNCKKYKN